METRKVGKEQGGLRVERSCVDGVNTVGTTIQDRKDAWLRTYCFSLDVYKVCGRVWVLAGERYIGNRDEMKYICGER